MGKNIFIKITILLLVFLTGFLTARNYILPKMKGKNVTIVNIVVPKKEVLGFLPYWLVNKATSDYSKYITNLVYFSLTIGEDGNIREYSKPGEKDPGYYSLESGKMENAFNLAKKNGTLLSLAVFNSNTNDISAMLQDPENSAKNLITSVTPIMQKYSFTELNIDIEQSSDASPEAREKFTSFVKHVRENIDPSIIKQLSIDVSASAFVKDSNLTDPKSFSSYVDRVIIMAYDYHYSGSYVTGPVAPLTGAGTVSELDTETAIEVAEKYFSREDIILGIPLYGYSWETLGDSPRSAVIPTSGVSISARDVESLLANCSSCSAVFDDTDKENHLIYKDLKTGVYKQIFYPSEKSTESKIKAAKINSLGGIALWALGYEDSTILEPLSSYHN